MLKGRELGNLWVDTPDFHLPMCGEVVGQGQDKNLEQQKGT